MMTISICQWQYFCVSQVRPSESFFFYSDRQVMSFLRMIHFNCTLNKRWIWRECSVILFVNFGLARGYFCSVAFVPHLSIHHFLGSISGDSFLTWLETYMLFLQGSFYMLGTFFHHLTVCSVLNPNVMESWQSIVWECQASQFLRP